MIINWPFANSILARTFNFTAVVCYYPRFV